jgi:hypothetical protein
MKLTVRALVDRNQLVVREPVFRYAVHNNAHAVVGLLSSSVAALMILGRQRIDVLPLEAGQDGFRVPLPLASHGTCFRSF